MRPLRQEEEEVEEEGEEEGGRGDPVAEPGEDCHDNHREFGEKDQKHGQGGAEDPRGVHHHPEPAGGHQGAVVGGGR